ncbi:YihY/virulence factor BrkB family protein [Fructilactobacillus vespulae]|uniref:YihY/virulence factor BrkB family protein n=1 Tax=Fructilactobacillus vespulae TaxID=1249630 RepID=UPI0039B36DF3
MKKIKIFLQQKGLPFGQIFMKHLGMGNVSDSAVVFAYYTLMSLFPILILISGAVKIANGNPDHVMGFFGMLMPASIFQMLHPIIKSAFVDGSGSSNFFIGLVLAIWSSSSAMAAFQRTVNLTYGFEKQSAFKNRVFSLIMMLFMVILLFIALILIGFSKSLVKLLGEVISISPQALSLIDLIRMPFILGFLFIILVLLYFLVPSVKIKLRYTIAGALFSLVGLGLLSQLFSDVMREFFKNISAYKTLGSFIVVMIWLNLTGVILLIGAVFNASFQDYFEKK